MKYLPPKIFFFLLFSSGIVFAGSNGLPYNPQKIDRAFLEILQQKGAGINVLSKYFLKKSSSIEDGKYSVIVYANSITEAEKLGVQPVAVFSTLFTADITLAQLQELSNQSSVQFIEAPKLRYPMLDSSRIDMNVDKVHQGLINGTSYKGSGVIIGIIDTGIDWKHLDFRSTSDTTKSRILYIKDYTTGKEFTQAQINNELDGTPAGVVDEKDISGHGTHVAGIAAGNGAASSGKYTGVAPEADLIIVKAGNGSFSTNNIINGISYILQKAAAAGKPVVINMSLGGHDGSHDGTSAEEIAVNDALTNAVGKQIIIAAGNEGNDGIHFNETVTAGATKTFYFTIPAYTPESGSENDYVSFSMWYKGDDDLMVKVASPSNQILTVSSGMHNQIKLGNDGFLDITNATSGANSLNNSKECAISIWDEPTTSSSAPAQGKWEISVTGGYVPQGGAFDIWISGSSMPSVEFDSPTYAKLVAMPGTAEKGITVGSYVTKWRWSSSNGSNYSYGGTSRVNNYSTFSSMGPTRDGRLKPDVSAPGQAIVSAISRDATYSAPYVVTGGKYVVEQGTSMASPQIAGLAALLLQAKPTLTAVEIRQKINSSARKDVFTGGAWSAQWGNGKADAMAALQSVLSVEKLSATTLPNNFTLAQNYPNPFNPETKINFSIPQSGFVTLEVYSSLGQKVASLVHENLDQGTYSTAFNGRGLASGIYFYTLRAGNYTETKKMLLLQ
ncbi:MAG: S8 family peptidase [Bacteroidetes bacterium]|nr:S8 family peptidase [Bacteroidota bacterium]